MKRLKVLLPFLGLLAATAFTAYVVNAYSVARFTPFYTSNAAWVAATGGQAGGRVNTFIAADTLKIGNVVYLATVDTVKKSTTLADYNTLAGVVVGGYRFGGTGANGTSIAASDSGTVVATAGQVVWVLKQGRTWVVNDANGTIAPGAFIIPSDATAGAVETKTTAIDTNYRVVGRAVIGAAASKFMLVDVNIR